MHTKGKLFQACVRSVVLYGSETFEVNEEDFAKLERNYVMMVRWMSNVTLKDRMSSDEVRVLLGLVII